MADVSMEKRMVLALILSAVVVLVWQARFAPKTPPTPPPSSVTQESPAPEGGEVVPSEAEAETEAGAPAAGVTPTLEGIAEEVTLRNQEVVLHMTSRGASIRQVELVHYNAPFDHDHRLRMLSPAEDLGALHVLDATGAVPLGDTAYRVARSTDREAVFEAAWSNGLRLEKRFALSEDAFHVDLTLEFANESQEPLTVSYLVVGSPGLEAETRKATDLAGKVCLNGRDVKTAVAGKLVRGAPKPYLGAELNWAAGVNQYFAVALVPREAPVTLGLLLPQGKAKLVRQLAALSTGPQANLDQAKLLAASTDFSPNPVALLLGAPVELAPGEQVTHEYRLFCGPQKDDVLAAYTDEALPQLVSFGIFSPLSSFILFILKGFYKAVHSYGLAIILLTVLIKVALLPLSSKSQTSMHRLQQIQPKIKELQERHKDDKQKLGEEQLRLFREHGVNPFGGCLPMLVQLPIFIALFRALRSSFELRQRSFLWIDDLSQPDAVATLPFSLPFLGNTLNVLPLLWIGSLVLTQKLTPKPKAADPQQKQQQMMATFFPLIFGVLLYNFPAGLLLYFVSMSVLTIAEQHYIRKKLAALPEPVPKKKSARQARRKPFWQSRRSKR